MPTTRRAREGTSDAEKQVLCVYASEGSHLEIVLKDLVRRERHPQKRIKIVYSQLPPAVLNVKIYLGHTTKRGARKGE